MLIGSLVLAVPLELIELEPISYTNQPLQSTNQRMNQPLLAGKPENATALALQQVGADHLF